jgi:hypothetical protein
MSMTRRSKHATLALAVLGAAAAQIATAVYVSSRNAAERSDHAALDLADDLLRASQAEIAAERMVSMSRAYLLTLEPELLARAHAAEAKLQQTLRGLGQRADVLQEGPLFAPILRSAHRYGELVQDLLTDTSGTSTPQGVAYSLRKRVIPARDRFEADLEELIARRQQQIAALHGTTRELSARAVPLMVGVSVFGLIASVMLVRLAARRGNSVNPGSTPSLGAMPTGGKVVPFSTAIDDGARQR